MNQLPRVFAICLITLPVILIVARLSQNKGWAGFRSGHGYDVTYSMQLTGKPGYSVRTFLPATNQRQKVTFEGDRKFSSISLENNNKVVKWKGVSHLQKELSLRVFFKGEQISYHIDPSINYKPNSDPKLKKYLGSTSYIQSEHHKIRALALHLSSPYTKTLDIIRSFYDYVLAMPSASTSELTDALMALENFEASCNGKSRLFVALCRNMKIPARVSGGLILEDTTKKTSHLWAEVYIGGQWAPFDALNGHFAGLPAHYMELYKGDHFLFRRTAGIPFEYQFRIEKKRVNHFPKWALINIWEVIDKGGIPVSMIMALLLLPLGTLLMGIFKNIVGIQTFGVFLPILIGLAFINSGLLPGLILFTVIVLVVPVINFPLEKWGIQYNAKISLMLTAVVIMCLLSVKLLHETQWYNSKSALFFPIIMVSIVCERFAKKIDEEGVVEAFKLYAATLLVTLILYFILSTPTIQNFIITFPEIIFTLAGFNLLLGKWIGLRLTEYYRFQKVINS